MIIAIDHSTFVACMALVREMETTCDEMGVDSASWSRTRKELQDALADAITTEANRMVVNSRIPALLRPQVG